MSAFNGISHPGGPIRPVTREELEQAFEWFDAGYSRKEIARRLDRNPSTVRNWVDNPDKYRPYIDEVAMMRAQRWELSVLENLTPWEWMELGIREAAARDVVSLIDSRYHEAYLALPDNIKERVKDRVTQARQREELVAA